MSILLVLSCNSDRVVQFATTLQLMPTNLVSLVLSRIGCCSSVMAKLQSPELCRNVHITPINVLPAPLAAPNALTDL